MAPDTVQVPPRTGPEGLIVSWRKVDRDVDNHQVADTTQTYRIFRADAHALLENVPLCDVPGRDCFRDPLGPCDADREVDRHGPGPRPAVRREDVLLSADVHGRRRQDECAVRDHRRLRARHARAWAH